MKTLAVRWILANTLGWCAAMVAFEQVPRGLDYAAVGLIVAAAQWLALRPHVAWLWIPGTAIAWSLGAWAAYAHASFGPDPFWGGGVGGALAAAAQGWLLRGRSKPWLWVVVTLASSLAGWLAGWRVGWDMPSELAYPLAGATGGLVIGVISAFALPRVERG